MRRTLLQALKPCHAAHTTATIVLPTKAAILDNNTAIAVTQPDKEAQRQSSPKQTQSQLAERGRGAINRHARTFNFAVGNFTVA